MPNKKIDPTHEAAVRCLIHFVCGRSDDVRFAAKAFLLLMGVRT